jgi:predicted nucleotidyltransferase
LIRAYILEQYLDAGNNERLFEEHRDLLDVESFDYVRAGARLLGRDLAGIGQLETIRRIREILAKETAEEGQYRLIRSMIQDWGVSDKETENRFDELLTLLRELLKGIGDR